jgi:CheY-like chemotaxis protein
MGESGSDEGARILLVEDEPDTARFVEYVLGERQGHDIAHVVDPAAAIAMVKAAHWDLILADLDLPGMSGVELLTAVREIAPGLPVALISASAEPPGAATYADFFIERPVTAAWLGQVTSQLPGLTGTRPDAATRVPGRGIPNC